MPRYKVTLRNEDKLCTSGESNADTAIQAAQNALIQWESMAIRFPNYDAWGSHDFRISVAMMPEDEWRTTVEGWRKG